MPGNDLDGIFTVSSLHKAIAIKDCLAKGQVGKAVVIGGGAIGIEMAEAMADLWGVETTIVEFMPQILPRIVDRTIASMVEQHLKENGVTVYTFEVQCFLDSVNIKNTVVLPGGLNVIRNLGVEWWPS